MMHMRLHFGHLVKAIPAGRVLSEPDLLVADSGLECEIFNVVALARFGTDNLDPRIAWVIESFEGRPFQWWVGPDDRPDTLSARLVAAGLCEVETETAMWLDLPHRESTTPSNAGLTIRRVSTPAELGHFGAVIAATWSPPDEHFTRFYEQIAEVALRSDCPLQFFVGYWRGEPVATCELTIAPDGVAGLYSIATLKGFRGRGFGSAMTANAVSVARASGMHRVALQASSDGAGIYERAGFRRVGEFREFKRP